MNSIKNLSAKRRHSRGAPVSERAAPEETIAPCAPNIPVDAAAASLIGGKQRRNAEIEETLDRSNKFADPSFDPFDDRPDRHCPKCGRCIGHSSSCVRCGPMPGPPVPNWMEIGAESGLLRLRDVLQILQISKSTFYAGIAADRFPRPVKIGPRASRWRAGETMSIVKNGAQP